ncbi:MULTISPECIES: tRNA (adenine(22)-N(1))-methyltransferase TrmK [Allobacillus]|uniref:tRNA (Adenine(22)-N(1))-methyltransferase TrmK n=1 Tax=Allobacillus salarius TaxID=1955272 RepID=A0A556PTK4_9BACI|nr:tRNA (adenine(22)-N(1))-methyltransferase TrmK [Allobacillus salarius]TSJ67730.1 tRNA (adenine(22)-N(1))-methyltransferase TrmK [Allobacillus salarius]
MRAMELSNRLKQVIEFLPEDVKKFADIGSDHAYLPCAVCLTRPYVQAIAGEVNRGPYESAQSQVKKMNLQEQIEVRLGNGLEVIEPNEVDTIIIAGMGGSLIRSILESHPEKLEGVTRLILQPNIDASSIREFSLNYGYQLIAERIINDEGYIYEVLVLEKSDQAQQLSDKEIYLGPFLMKEKNAAFIEKWQHVFEKKQKIIEQIKQAKNPDQNKINLFEQQKSWIKEELQ